MDERGSGPFGREVPLHHLQRDDHFEFLDGAIEVQGQRMLLPRRLLLVTIAPWGPKTSTRGPVGPWMFAAKDDQGVERHFALPPLLKVRLVKKHDR